MSLHRIPERWWYSFQRLDIFNPYHTRVIMCHYNDVFNRVDADQEINNVL